MPQDQRIRNLRRRLTENGFKEIKIEKIPKKSSVEEDTYKVTVFCPFSCCQETRKISASEAVTILRKHKVIGT